MFNPVKLKLYGVIAAALVTTHTLVYFNGKSAQIAEQAEADTQAYIEGVADAADSWQRKLDRAVKTASNEATKKANAKEITTKVKDHVKDNFTIVKCYDDTSLQYINQAIKNTRN